MSPSFPRNVNGAPPSQVKNVFLLLVWGVCFLYHILGPDARGQMTPWYRLPPQQVWLVFAAAIQCFVLRL